MSQKQVVTRPGGTPKWTRDAATNDSDKSFTVPTGKEWDLKYIIAQIATTATVGNRLLVIAINNGTNDLWKSYTTGSIAASQYGISLASETTQRDTTARKRLDDATTDANVTVQSPLPDMILPAGYVIRVWDVAAIDAAADDLIVILNYIEYEA